MTRFFLAALALLIVPACASGPCIVPPAMDTSEQNTVAATIAANLAGAPASGNLSVNFSTIVKTDYDKLNDNDKALYLMLLAVECYLKEGKVGQDIAKQMAKLVQDKWGAKEAASRDPRKLDERSPTLAPRIHEIRKKVGLE
jgi:hypothetical protein